MSDVGFTAHQHKKAISRRPVLEMNSETTYLKLNFEILIFDYGVKGSHHVHTMRQLER